MVHLNKLTIREALHGLKRGDFSSYDLVLSCVEQMEKVDGNLRAFITKLADKALENAKKADILIKENGPQIFDEKPLLGIPYACKDNFCTKGILTTAASNVLRDFVPPYESTVTDRLHKAGAILLGKTNMDAFAHGSSTETSDFYITKNPLDESRSPGGSSGGSACAVAANMCIFAIGSETAGSVRGPASWCGVYGLKPTYGRVSRYGLIAMASSTDCPGVLAKSVWDAGFVLKIIAGKDNLDATTSSQEVDDYIPSPNIDFKNLKVGLPRSYLEIDLQKEVKEALELFINNLKELGIEVIDINLLSPQYSIAVYTILQRSEVSSNLARMDGIRYGNTRESFGFEARNRMMLGAYTLSVGYYDEYYLKAQKVRTLIIKDFDEAFNKVDLIIGPTMPCTALKIGESAKSPIFGELMDVLNEPSAIAGLPAISLPFGKDENNLPIGVQIIAPQLKEKLLLDFANYIDENVISKKTF